jgi:O-antigen/teichoic acid export membrane protein
MNVALGKNVLWNFFGIAFPLGVALLLTPFLIKTLGLERFGLLTIIWSIIGYFSLFDFGLGRSLTQKIALSLSENNPKQIPILVKSGLVFTAKTGFVGLILLLISSYHLGYFSLHISSNLRFDATMSLIITALGIPLTTIATGCRGILEGFENFKFVSICRLVSGIANYSFPLVSILLFGPSLFCIAITLVIARFFLVLIYWFYINKLLPNDWTAQRIDPDKTKELLQFGLWMSVSNIISPLMVYADRFMISAYLGASMVAYYTVPFEIVTRLLIIPSAFTGVFFPRMTSLLRENVQEAGDLYHRALFIMSLIMIPICCFISLGSYSGLNLWLGSDFAQHSWFILCLLSLGVLVNGIASIPFAMIQATGNAKLTAMLHLFEFCIYIPILIYCLYVWGIIGAAVAWALRVTIDLIFLLVSVQKSILKRVPSEDDSPHFSSSTGNMPV